MQKRTIQTPLGSMIAISDDQKLHRLRFILEDEPLFHDTAKPLLSIEEELKSYFEGKLKHFKTPLHIEGTLFQQNTWQQLLAIPFGEVRSYSDLAKALNKPTAFRAVALANSQNRFAIMIPCHRVIYKDGTLGGYADGIERKKRLLAHEKTMFR